MWKFFFSRMFAFQKIYVHLSISVISSRVYQEVQKMSRLWKGRYFGTKIARSRLVLRPTSYKVEKNRLKLHL